MSAIGHTDAAFGASFKCLDLMLQLASPCILQPSHIVGFGGGGEDGAWPGGRAAPKLGLRLFSRCCCF